MASKKLNGVELRLRISEQDDLLYHALISKEGSSQRCEFIRRMALVGIMRQIEMGHAGSLPYGSYAPQLPEADGRQPVARQVSVPMAEKELPSEFDEDDISKLFSEDILKE